MQAYTHQITVVSLNFGA